MSSWEEWKRNKRGELAANNLDKQLRDALRKSVTVKVCPECEKRSKWMPIETAPRDGSAILVIKAGSRNGVPFQPVVASWISSWEDQGYEGPWEIVDGEIYWDDDIWNPTHWMPPPEPPQEKADETK